MFDVITVQYNSEAFSRIINQIVPEVEIGGLQPEKEIGQGIEIHCLLPEACSHGLQPDVTHAESKVARACNLLSGVSRDVVRCDYHGLPKNHHAFELRTG